MELESQINGLRIEYAALTDLGRHRKNNEDAFGFDPECNFAVVCDGMGGANAGEVASNTAVDCLMQHFRSGAWRQSGENPRILDPDFSLFTNALGSALLLANESVMIQASAEMGRRGMGTTCVATWIPKSSLSPEGTPLMSITWAGDSRVYLLRGNLMRALTRDHSIVMEQVRRGLLTYAEARLSPLRNVLSRALGTDEDLQPGLAELPLISGDMILLCSDGLCGVVEDEDLQAILNMGVASQPAIEGEIARVPLPLDEICQKLIREANMHGGPDNITALLIRVADA